MMTVARQQIGLLLKALVLSAGIIFLLTMGNGNAEQVKPLKLTGEKLELWKLASNISVAKLFTDMCHMDLRTQFNDGVKESNIRPSKECKEAQQLVNETREQLLDVKENYELYSVPEIEYAVVISEEAMKMCQSGYPMKCVQFKL